MRETDFVRVRLVESGHQVTISRALADSLGDDAVEVLDDKPAIDTAGQPLTAKPYLSLAERSAPYEEQTRQTLLDTIGERNAVRDPDHQLDVDSHTVKDDLVAALVADDQALSIDPTDI